MENPHWNLEVTLLVTFRTRDYLTQGSQRRKVGVSASSRVIQKTSVLIQPSLRRWHWSAENYWLKTDLEIPHRASETLYTPHLQNACAKRNDEFVALIPRLQTPQTHPVKSQKIHLKVDNSTAMELIWAFPRRARVVTACGVSINIRIFDSHFPTFS